MSAARLRALGAALLLAVVASAGGTALQSRAGASDPVYVEWPALLPGLTDEYDPGSSNDCVAGKLSCITAMVREMERRYRPLAASCSHQALFALTYLRVTQTYAWSAQQPGYYPDVRWTNHAVAVFAKYYLRAYDDWTADNSSTAVPRAWRLAFDAARDRTASGSGNFFLGLNAHINRDLAFAMAAAGLVGRDGVSEKPNFDRVNRLLNSVSVPLVAELAARLDPSMDDSASPFHVDAVATGNLMFGWREQAWRNAELLSTSSDLLRPTVAATIETNAVTQATAYASALRYVPPALTSAERDAWCAAHNGDPAPVAYPFGVPSG